MLAAATRTRNPNLSFPIGAAFERGLLALGPNEGNTDGRELLQAADIYAGLHRQIWGRLPKDIEASITQRYGHDAWQVLLEVGRVHSPAPPNSHFRSLVGKTPVPSGEADPEEYLRRRLKVADRYAGARKILQTAGFRAVMMVEHVVIDGITPAFLRPGVTITARGAEDRHSLVCGLNALAQAFGLFRQDGARV